jgi:hypothetical protein
MIMNEDEMLTDIDLAAGWKFAKIREQTMCVSRGKTCPQCGTDQIQLIEWIEKIKWRCRHCKHKFEGTTDDT